MASVAADRPAPADDLDLLLELLPESFRSPLKGESTGALLEVILDLGRPPEARFTQAVARLAQDPVTIEDIAYVTHRLGEFGGDNRAGITGTLHRISAIRNRRGDVVGLTLRVGRTVFGTIDLIRDLLESGINLLLLGRPGVGKTTKLRETARILSDDLEKRVIVVDTSNEIGGDGDIPHPAIGGARRMQVPLPDRQHAVMIEAVENHMPEVIIVDEIGTSAEAAAARTIAERGVQLIGTAHGTTLENLILNPTLSDLIGGVHTVTLSDEEARRQRRPKTVTERKGPPTFDAVVELVNRDEVIVHRNTAVSVDAILLGRPLAGERRLQGALGRVELRAPEQPHEIRPSPVTEATARTGPTRIYPFDLNRDLLDRVIRNLQVEARTVRDPRTADLILAQRSSEEDPRLARILEENSIPAHFAKKDNATSMRRILQELFVKVADLDTEEVREAMRETEHAIQRVLNENIEVALAPRRPAIRKLQHRIIARYHLDAESVGTEPVRHLVVYPAWGAERAS